MSALGKYCQTINIVTETIKNLKTSLPNISKHSLQSSLSVDSSLDHQTRHDVVFCVNIKIFVY